MVVFPGDVIVRDRKGVFVIPAHMADGVAVEAVEMIAFEDFVMDEVPEADPSSASIRRRSTSQKTTLQPGAWRETGNPTVRRFAVLPACPFFAIIFIAVFTRIHWAAGRFIPLFWYHPRPGP